MRARTKKAHAPPNLIRHAAAPARLTPSLSLPPPLSLSLSLSTHPQPPSPPLQTICCPGRWAPTPRTPCPPPISIVGWFGRAGNNLAQLTAAVAVGNATGSVVVAPAHPLLAPRAGGAAARVWDFRSPACVAAQGGVVLDDEAATAATPASPAFYFDGVAGGGLVPAAVSLWFYRSSCAAAGLDALPATARRAAATSFITPRLFPPAPAPGAPPAPPHLLIHLRGGDVFALAGGGGARFYGQPPLAMYKRILGRDGGYLAARASITVLHEDDANPVVGGLRAFLEAAGAADRVTWVKGGGAAAAAAALAGATHLVAAESSLSLGFGLVAAPRLVRAFIPFCRRAHTLAVLYDDGPAQARSGRASRAALADVRTAGGASDPGVPGRCYEFPGFTPFGEWTGTPEQRDALLSYEEGEVQGFDLPAGGGAVGA